MVENLAASAAEPSFWDVARTAVRQAMGIRDMPAQWLDRSTGLLNRRGMIEMSDEMLKARKGAPVVMVVVELPDLRELNEIYGSAVCCKLVAKVVQKLQVVAGQRGLAARTDAAQFTVVLPIGSTDKARRALQRVLGSPARIELDAGDDEIVLVPEVLVDMTEPGATSVVPAYRDMCREVVQLRKDEQRRQHYLTR